MNGGGNDIDSLKFGIVLDSKKFEDEMKRVEGLAEKFEKSVREALDITKKLDKAQSNGAADAERKVKAEKEIVLLSRQELEAKKAAGTITDKELKQLNALIRADKAKLEEEKKQLDIQKKQLDIQGKQEKMTRQRAAAEKQVGEGITLTSNQLLGQSTILKGIGSYLSTYLSVFGAATVVRNLVRITGEFEAQRVALRAILNDVTAADNIFDQLQTLAVRSPFTFKDLTSYAKQLTAFSVPVEEVYDTTKKLADISAGLGVDMGRIILAYGQVRSAEFLRGQEVRQFTEAGIPILKELATQFEEIEGHAVSVREVFDRISKRQVPFEMVAEAFNRMTSEGGKFYNMQEVLAETVKGKISNLQDAWEIMLSKIGNEQSGLIKNTITGLTNLFANYERWIGLVGTLIKYLGIYSAALLTFNTIAKVTNGLQAISNGLAMVQNAQMSWANILLPTNNALEKIALANKKEQLAVQTALNLARNTALGILTALGTLLFVLYQRYKKINAEQRAYNEATAKASGYIATERSELTQLASIAGNELNSMKERQSAIDIINSEYSEYLHNLGIEKVSVENLGTAYNQLTDAIANKYLAQLHEQTVGVSESKRNDIRTSLIRFNTEILGKIKNNKGDGVSAYDAGAILSNIEQFVQSHPFYGRDELFKAIKDIYSERGFNIAPYSRDEDKLFDLVEKYVNANQQVRSAEQSFQSFAAGYNKSLDDFRRKSGSDLIVPTEADYKAMEAADNAAAGAVESKVNLLNEMKEAYDGFKAASFDEDQINKLFIQFFGTGVPEEGFETMKTWRQFLSEVNAADKAYEDIWSKFDKDWGVGKNGIDGDIDKIVTDYNNEKKKIKEEYEDAVIAIENEGAAHGWNAEQIKKEMDRLHDLYEERSNANHTAAQEKLNDLASKYVSEKTGSLDMNDWGDKSIGQIREINETLKALIEAGVIVDEEVKERVESASLTLDKFITDAQEGMEDLGNKAETEFVKKMGKILKELAQDFSDISSAVADFAEATGRSDLAGFAKTWSGVISTVGSILEKAAKKDVIGVVGVGIKFIASKILEAATATARLNAKLAELSEQSHRTALTDALVATGIFGEDSIKRLRNANGVMAYTLADMQNKAALKNHNMGAQYGGMRESVLDMMARNGLAAYDENGILNRDSLNALKEIFPEMDRWLTILINDADAYYEALESVNDVMQNLLGNVVDDAADQMIDKWITMGSAALDYADILDSVARSYAQMTVKSMLMESLDENLAKNLASMAMNGETDKFMATLASAMEGLEAMAPYVNAAMEAFGPYIKTGTENNSVGSGIKSITEETASLFASYVNAIRADVSVIRGFEEKKAAIMQTFAVSIPTLNDYLQQIAATNFDIAQSNQRILSEIQSVIGAEGTSGSIVRVQIS